MKKLTKTRNPSFAAYDTLERTARAYAAGMIDRDPTTREVAREILATPNPSDPRPVSLPDASELDALINSVRADTLAHLARREQNRMARLNAARHRSGRTSDGELVEGEPDGVAPEPEPTPTTWAEVRAARLGRGRER